MFLRRAVVIGLAFPYWGVRYEQLLSLANTSSRINHRNCIGFDDAANIDGPFISAGYEFHHARVNEKAPVRVS
jgi:hypothetical protein